jgi:ABC-type Fe3+-hydroxamate transport system substrate-binding protein
MQTPTEHSLNDMMGRSIRLSTSLKRIVSVVPSQTELLYDLGLNDEVVGITKFCIHPDEWFHSKTRIGGTKKLNIEAILALKPDVVFANKEENTQAELEELAQHVPVWISDVRNLDDALRMIEMMGDMLDKEDAAERLIQKIKSDFAGLVPLANPKKAIYLIWREPYMSINSDTFIHDLLNRCGLVNLSANRTERYPQLSPEQLHALNPELVLLSSEPFPFAEKHIAELQRLLPKARIGLVDGEAFSWYGSRLCQSAPYFKQLLRFWGR